MRSYMVPLLNQSLNISSKTTTWGGKKNELEENCIPEQFYVPLRKICHFGRFTLALRCLAQLWRGSAIRPRSIVHKSATEADIFISYFGRNPWLQPAGKQSRLSTSHLRSRNLLVDKTVRSAPLPNPVARFETADENLLHFMCFLSELIIRVIIFLSR